jgi:hypothetical protein
MTTMVKCPNPVHEDEHPSAMVQADGSIFCFACHAIVREKTYQSVTDSIRMGGEITIPLMLLRFEGKTVAMTDVTFNQSRITSYATSSEVSEDLGQPLRERVQELEAEVARLTAANEDWKTEYAALAQRRPGEPLKGKAAADRMRKFAQNLSVTEAKSFLQSCGIIDADGKLAQEYL